jgi:hypothetical protein
MKNPVVFEHILFDLPVSGTVLELPLSLLVAENFWASLK